jgi:hypothetical protein
VAWLDVIQADSLREFETRLLCDDDDDDPDPDYVAACVDFVQAKHAQAREEELRNFREFLDEHNIGA